MKKFKIYLFLVLLNFGNLILAQSDKSYMPELLGLWLSENKKQKIRVYYDSNSKTYYGKAEWMYEDDQANGRVLLDSKNENPNLRSRRVTGITMLHSFEYEGNSKFRGYIYDPISGKEYRCLLSLRKDKTTVDIRGYILIPWIGRSEVAKKISN